MKNLVKGGETMRVYKGTKEDRAYHHIDTMETERSRLHRCACGRQGCKGIARVHQEYVCRAVG